MLTTCTILKSDCTQFRLKYEYTIYGFDSLSEKSFFLPPDLSLNVSRCDSHWLHGDVKCGHSNYLVKTLIQTCVRLGDLSPCICEEASWEYLR